MDLFLFEKINSLVGVWPFLDQVGIFLAGPFASVLAAVTIVFVFKERLWRKKEKLLVLIGSVVLSRLVLTEAIRLFWLRPRPAIALETARKLVEISPYERFNSFPSGHATFFFALAAAVYLCHHRLGLFFFAAAILIGLAKIFVASHWPSDVLAGAFIGLASAFVVNWLAMKIFRANDRTGN